MQTISSNRADRDARRARILGLSTALRAGVQAVVADQLFASGPELAGLVVSAADIRTGQRLLDPSAGTGDLLAAVPVAVDVQCLAIEIHPGIASALRGRLPSVAVSVADFLQCAPEVLGLVDRIIMNPPFRNGADIAHIQHARRFLSPGGRLVAICANGPRQQAQLRPAIEAAGGTWTPLPADTFKHAGTAVRTAMLVIDS